MAKQFGVFTIRADGLAGKKADQFEAQVLGMIRGLEAIEAGRALLNGFRAVGREVLVFPYNDSLGHCNAYATTDWGMYRNKVSFTPSGWFATSPCFTSGSAGNSSHEVLFHELVHAIRFAGGPLGGIPRAIRRKRLQSWSPTFSRRRRIDRYAGGTPISRSSRTSPRSASTVRTAL